MSLGSGPVGSVPFGSQLAIVVASTATGADVVTRTLRDSLTTRVLQLSEVERGIIEHSTIARMGNDV